MTSLFTSASHTKSESLKIINCVLGYAVAVQAINENYKPSNCQSRMSADTKLG